MSRSYKKQRITKDIDKYNKKLGNKKLRRITNQLLKLGNTESIPKKKREVQNDYDVTYWNFSICTEQEICKIANLIQTTQEMFEKFKDYSLFNFCELFNKHK